MWDLGFGHTESRLPQRAAICARSRKALELYYVRVHHPRQTEGGLMRRTSLDHGGQPTFVFWRQIWQAGSTEWRKNSLKNQLKSAGVGVLVRYRSPGVQEPCDKSWRWYSPKRSLFLLISCIHHRPLFLLQLSADISSSSSSELDIMN